MGQVAFDTQEFVETLENAGLHKDQARAISIAVRKSHEVADVATRRDLEDAKKDIGARFDRVEAQIQSQSEKTDAKIAEVKRDVAEVRKDLAFEIADARKEAAARADRTDAQIQARFEKSDALLALLRKDVESLTKKLVIKMASIMVGVIGVATAIIKLF